MLRPRGVGGDRAPAGSAQTAQEGGRRRGQRRASKGLEGSAVLSVSLPYESQHLTYNIS